MRLVKPLIVITVIGLSLPACGAAPTVSTSARGVAEAGSASASSSMPTTSTPDKGLYPPGFDPGAYRPPEHWRTPCKDAYSSLSVGLLSSWNAIRNLLEQKGDAAYHAATVKVGYEQLIDAPQKEALRNCRQADPTIGAQFDRGIEATRIAVGIVCAGAELSSCQGAELSPDERAELGNTVRSLLNAVPAQR
ncbi:hypothetical protein [Streptosporangium sp. NPDC002524]|uniref:hypothetical protein n=1 Tax=Streptosporangium sp. NPDC002524 TaxID=3154537 RepID=UPI00332E240C